MIFSTFHTEILKMKLYYRCDTDVILLKLITNAFEIHAINLQLLWCI